MTIELRSATVDDVDALQRVARRAWHEAHAPIVGAETVDAFLDEHYDESSFRARITADEAIFDAAVDADLDADDDADLDADDDAVIGFVLASPDADDSTTFDLSQIYVHPDRWGEGIGQRLLEHVHREISARGGERVQLGVMAANDRAVRFYESAGYSRRDEFYDDRIDARGYTYVKALEPNDS